MLFADVVAERWMAVDMVLSVRHDREPKLTQGSLLPRRGTTCSPVPSTTSFLMLIDIIRVGPSPCPIQLLRST